jgi:hypothetical protein
MNGAGKMTYPDGSEYDGQFKNDKRNGKGVLTYSNGDTYNGLWKNDRVIIIGIVNNLQIIAKWTWIIRGSKWTLDVSSTVVR